MSELGERLKRVRESRNMTQEELAIKAGLKSKSTISKIESGHRDTKRSRIKLLADALNVDVTYLIGTECGEVARAYDLADDQTREAVRNLLGI